MTTPDDNPSFLARLAIVAHIGVVVSQALLGLYCVVAKFQDAPPPISPSQGLFFFLVLPMLFHAAFFGFYFLVKGKPKDADKHLEEEVLPVALAVSGWGGLGAWLILCFGLP